MKELEITKGEWKIRLFPEGDDFFVEAPNLNKPELGYGIEIMQDDFGTHNGYPREQRLADAVLIADAGNTAQKCGLLPSELLRQRDELKEALKVCHTSLKTYGSHPLIDAQAEAAIKNTELK